MICEVWWDWVLSWLLFSQLCADIVHGLTWGLHLKQIELLDEAAVSVTPSSSPLSDTHTHTHTLAMPAPSDSSSVASASGSRGWSDSRRGMSGRGPGGARLLLYLGLCHLCLGAMVLAFSFTSMAFTSSARVRQSCPFWAGFFVSCTNIVILRPHVFQQHWSWGDMICNNDDEGGSDYGLWLKVVASGIVGIISWRRPLTLVVRVFLKL